MRGHTAWYMTGISQTSSETLGLNFALRFQQKGPQLGFTASKAKTHLLQMLQWCVRAGLG